MNEKDVINNEMTGICDGYTATDAVVNAADAPTGEEKTGTEASIEDVTATDKMAEIVADEETETEASQDGDAQDDNPAADGNLPAIEAPDSIADTEPDKGDTLNSADAMTASHAIEPEIPVGQDSETIAQLVAEAEQRGYVRGRNERIGELMGAPSMWQPSGGDSDSRGESQVMILDNVRRSVWDD